MGYRLTVLLLISISLLSLSGNTLGWSHHKQQQERHSAAVTAMQQGNFAVAYCIWQPLATDGDPRAQYNLGWMYHNGYGLRIDDQKAFELWLEAAQRGSIDALAALGDLYADGLGVERNQSIALGFYISAAIKSHEIARETLLAYLDSDQPEVLQTFKHILQSNEWPALGNVMAVGVVRANTRQGPGVNFPIVATLDKDHPIIPLRVEQDWTYVGIPGIGKTAWIFTSLIAKPQGLYPQESVEPLPQ